MTLEELLNEGILGVNVKIVVSEFNEYKPLLKCRVRDAKNNDNYNNVKDYIVKNIEPDQELGEATLVLDIDVEKV